ncbi:MAG TPA: S8 family serine peptidase [Trueperaceae bacterium]
MSDSRSGTRATARLVVVAVAVMLASTACQTATVDPAAERLKEAIEEGVDLAGFKPDESLRARFLPPVGAANPRGEFVVGMPLEVAAFALAPGDGEAVGEPLGPVLGTALGGVTFAGDTYTLTWPVLDPNVAERVRLEIRMPGSGGSPVCGEAAGECLGFLDVRIVERGGPGRGGGDSEPLITVPSGGSFTVRFKVLVPESIEGLAELSGQGGLDVEHGNCPASEVSLPGQGLQAVGAGLQAVGAGLQAVGAGGLFVASVGALESEALSVQDVVDAFQGLGAAEHDVMLVVLDDFGGVYDLPFALTDRDLAALSDEALAALAADGRISHGAIVLHEVVALLTAALGDGVAGTEASLGGAPYVEFSSYGEGPRVRVQAVDARSAAGDIDTDEAARALEDALTTARGLGFQRVVVNMSFGVVPCGVLEDFARSEEVTFDEYVAALLGLNGVSGATADELAEELHLPVELASDPFFAALACPPTGGATCGTGLDSVVFVAASGNYGQGFPLFPAALAGVVSVGSQGVDGGALVATASDFSNAAAVLAPGDLVVVRTQGRLGLALAGTSFAAPVVASFAALDQQAQQPVCAGGDPADPVGSPAALAVQDLDELPLLPGFAAGGDSALVSLCGG